MKTTPVLLSIALFLLAIAPIHLVAQRIQKGCSFTGLEANKEYILKNASPEFRKIVDDILNEMSISRGNFTLKEANVNNAMAAKMDGERYILYNPFFLEKFKKDSATQNAAYAILAHEIGHHFHGHEFDENNSAKSKQDESEADYFAGGVLFSLCRSESDASSVYKDLPERGTKTHPSRENRIMSLTEGWQERKKLKGTNPCDQLLEFNPTPMAIRRNRAKNVRGEINRHKIVYTYDVDSDKPFAPYLYIKGNISIRPKSIEWKDKRTAPGIDKQVVWHYKKDGYTYNMVNRKDWIGLLALPDGFDTKPPKPIVYVGLGGAALLGAAGVGLGLKMRSDALSEYEVYEENRVPGVTPYTTEKTRSDYYSDANKKYKTSQYLMIGGGTLLGVAGYLLIKKISNRPPPLSLYCGSDGLCAVSLEPLFIAENGVQEAGIRLRF